MDYSVFRFSIISGIAIGFFSFLLGLVFSYLLKFFN